MRAETIRVMSFNLWHGGTMRGQSVEESARVIRAANADIVGLQETAGVAPQGKPRPDSAAALAQILGWEYLDQGGNTGILSRFPIIGHTPKKWGAKLRLPSGQTLYHFNAHLMHAPYQPYQLLNIPYHNGPFLKTEAEAVVAARAARGDQVQRLLAETEIARRENLSALLTGDFNEPSHRDWTAAAVSARRCPLKVEWPTTKAIEDAGFADAYRRVHPDPLRRPGLTWTPTTAPDDPKDHHDRIDFVFARGPHLRPLTARIVGEAPHTADIVVPRYPSDHRALVCEFQITTPA